MNKILLNLAFLLLPLTALGLEPWALVRVAVANVREKPSHAAEMGTQVVMGTPLKVDEQVGDSWLKSPLPMATEVMSPAIRLLRFRKTVCSAGANQTGQW